MALRLNAAADCVFLAASGRLRQIEGDAKGRREMRRAIPPSPLLRMGAEVSLQTGSMASVSEVGSRVRERYSRGVVGVFSYLPAQFSAICVCNEKYVKMN